MAAPNLDPKRHDALARELAVLKKDVALLKRKLDAVGGRAAGPSLLGRSLKDVQRIPYNHPDDAPPDGSILKFDTSLDSAYGGLWRAVDSAPIADSFTSTGTGLRSVSEDLVDGDWDPDRLSLVFAWATCPGTYNYVESTPGAITATVAAGTYDVEIDTVAAELEYVDPIEFSSSDWSAVDPRFNAVADPRLTLTLLPSEGVSGTYPTYATDTVSMIDRSAISQMAFFVGGGTPAVQCSASMDATAYPGSHTLTVYTVVIPW